MAIEIDQNLDFNQNQALNMLLHNISGNPGAPADGQVWWDTSVGEFKFYDGSNNQTVASRSYVDSAITGLDYKDECRVATQGNITLSGTQTIDDVSVIAGDRVLVKAQTSGEENGIYVVAAGAWSRATDADTDAEVNSGMFCFVSEGTADADTGWVLSTNDPITLDTTSLSFSKFTGSGTITAGAGLTKSGNTIDVGAGTGISVNADDIQISASYAGQASITTLGVIGTGTWQGSVIAVAYGGTGGATAAAAKTNLGFTTVHAEDIGDGIATQYDVQHDFGSRDVIAVIRNNSSPWEYRIPEFQALDTNNTRIIFSAAISTNQYRAIIIG